MMARTLCRKIRTNQFLKVHAALLLVAEKWRGTFKVATKELPINSAQDGIPQSPSKNFDQTGNSSGFIFDVTLSTAIAADGKLEAKATV